MKKAIILTVLLAGCAPWNPRPAFYGSIAATLPMLQAIDAWLYSPDAEKRPEVRKQVEDIVAQVNSVVKPVDDALKKQAECARTAPVATCSYITPEVTTAAQEWLSKMLQAAQTKIEETR